MEAIQHQTATPDSVWAMFQEIGRKQEETALQMKETREQMQETDRRMKELQKTVGGWANNHGSFAEEYFFNSFENGKQKFFGEHFDEIQKNVSSVWQGVKDEYAVKFNYKDFKIYLGLASLSFYPELEQRCINEGIAIIKQVGDSVVINDEHLKVF